MKKRIVSILLAIAMLVGMVPLGAVPAFAETGEEIRETLHSSTGGQTIGDTDIVSYYYVNSDTSCTAEEAGVSGLSIKDWAEVHIIVAAGATLTCTGADGNGRTTGGGAGILVPEHATLYLEGEGAVEARGGNAANGADGVDGESGNYFFDGTWNTFWEILSYAGGDGGKGGDGGAGAGAGIGTAGGNGGAGGSGGKGDRGEVGEDHLDVTAGKSGFPGAMAQPKGAIRTSRTVKLTADGGADGKGGNATEYVYVPYYSYKELSSKYHTAVPGCNGGGGQGGGAGAAVGTGGQGGGGGAGGNGSPAIYSSGNGYFGAKLYSGYGGGNTDGNYVEGSNMGKGGVEFTFFHNNESRGLMGNYPYRERNFGGAGGASGVHIHTFDEDGWCIECTTPEWVIDENGVVLKYNGLGGTAVVPEGVTRIANDVFNSNKAVTGIVFPSTLEEIGSSAFNGSGLTSVSFPSSIKTVGHNAFQNCASLTSVTFPEEGEITILNSTFQGIPLTSLDIPVSVKAIGYSAFRDCTNLKSVTVHWTEADKIITPQGDAFSGIASDCGLYVPLNTTELYKSNAIWGKFSLISDTMPYMAYDFESKTLVQKTTQTAPVQLTSSEESVALTGGWYAVDGEVTVAERITVSGDTKLILKDGCTLTLKQGLAVSAHGSLTIYGQEKGTGALKTSTRKVSDHYAAIGVGEFAVLNIHGGEIEVCGGKYAAGIGGGYHADGGNIAVYGGSVKAQGSSGGAGIGGGSGGNGGSFTIYGGKVYAYGDYAAGIGGGENGNGGEVTVNGGEVDANNAIGDKGSKVVINDGKVTVSGNIGGIYSTVEINGGDVKVNNGTIGVYYNTGKDAEITIRGGNIDAYCYNYPTIGGNTSNVKVNIYGGSIKAQSNSMDAIVATSVQVYSGQCKWFTVKDFSGKELPGSPITEEKDVAGSFSGYKTIQINYGITHTFPGDCIDNGDGTHCRKCTGCDALTAPEQHNFADGVCAACGAGSLEVKYIVRSWDSNKMQVVSAEADQPVKAAVITQATTALDGGWYVVSRRIENENRIVVKGTVKNPTNVVLMDGAKLDAKAGIEVANGNVLNIYGQNGDTGELAAYGDEENAAIGSSSGCNSGRFTVYGGTVTATATDGAGIGGGAYGSGGSFTMNGGTVTATSTNGAGIGGGACSSDYVGYNSGSLIMNGGTVTATSTDGAGIGGGANAESHIIVVSGGTVTATSTNGAGIGGGANAGSRMTNVYGGTVTATSTNGAGIGGGVNADCNTITVKDGSITATSTNGAGIGGGRGGKCHSLHVFAGAITATSTNAVGIGNGADCEEYGYGSFRFENENIVAYDKINNSFLEVYKGTVTELIGNIKSIYIYTEDRHSGIPTVPFTDVPADAWYTEAVLWCNEKGYMIGTGEKLFSPEKSLTRAMFVQVLARVSGADLDAVEYTGAFTDVPKDAWYAKAVEWAKAENITSGTSETAFSPAACATREQLAKFLYAYAQRCGYDTSGSADLGKYTDAAAISDWARSPLEWAVANGIIVGTGETTLSPSATATRAQTALMLMRFVKKTGDGSLS